MKPISFVICAAGEGTRFKARGVALPKARIILNGMTMLERSVSSLDMKPIDQLIIISQKEDQLPLHFAHLKNVHWIEISTRTKGQLETFLHAVDLIIHEDIVIYNCDTYFSSLNMRSIIASQKYAGLIPCSKVSGNTWSFCKVDENLQVLNVAEKDRISDWASVGYYYFKGKKNLMHFSKIEIASHSSKEPYVAPIYNHYITAGFPVVVTQVDTFLPFGTPEQIHEYWGISFEQLLAQNS